ncbi:MAG: hypothetical protein M1840_000019 [Geoglossum simile]|nr:MAG: hypothetical protein M1840_000019 [Geoglossum simile]
MAANVDDYNLIAQGFHTSCCVDLEFMSRIPEPRGSMKYSPCEFVAGLLEKPPPEKRPLRIKYSGLSGTEGFNDEDTWTITPDETLKPEPSDPHTASGLLNSIVTGMELVSPGLNFDHNDWPDGDLENLCGQLAPDKDRDCHFWTNKSCGLHVHVRVNQNPNPDFEVDDLGFFAIQNVIAIWGVYEKEIEKFHPEHRRAPHNRYAASLRSKAPHLRNDPAGSTADWLTLVYACKDFDDLRNLVQNNTGVGDARDSKINIVAYSPRDSDKARPDRDPTIEFREHAGSLDPVEITFWIAFVSKMVLFGVWLAKSGLVFDIENVERCYAEDLLDGLHINGVMRLHYVLKIMGETFDHLFIALRQSAARFGNFPEDRVKQISADFKKAKEGHEEDEEYMLALGRMINTGLGLAEAPGPLMGCRMLYYEQLSKCKPETMDFVHKGVIMAWFVQMQ